MKYNKFLNKEIAQLVKKYNGTVCAGDKSANSECITLKLSQIDWSNKSNQTRDGDLDRGHLASLYADINSRGLKNLPIVEYNHNTELWQIVSGHHRTSVIKDLISREESQIEAIPCAAVSFDNNVDRELFMQSENHHPPVKAHTRKDAIRFIRTMRNHGHFDTHNADLDTLKKEVYSLLDQFYSRLNSKRKEEVFAESFKDKEITRVLTVLKGDIKSSAKQYYKNLKSFSWDKNKYLCWGDTNSARKAIAVSLERRVHDIDKGKVKATDPRGKITVVTHFDSENIEKLSESRMQFIKTEELMNRFAYLPGNLVMVEEIAFIPQVDGKKGIKETSLIKYRWDYENQCFKKA